MLTKEINLSMQERLRWFECRLASNFKKYVEQTLPTFAEPEHYVCSELGMNKAFVFAVSRTIAEMQRDRALNSDLAVPKHLLKYLTTEKELVETTFSLAWCIEDFVGVDLHKNEPNGRYLP